MPTPTLDLAPVRTAIKNKIAGVAGIGNVHNRERYAKTAADLLTEYRSSAQSGQRILGWFVSLMRRREWSTEYGQRWYADVQWKIHGYMSLDDGDSSELLIAALADKIADAFRDDDTLGGTVYSCIDENAGNEAGFQVDEFDQVLFAGVLCHRVRGRLFTRLIF